MSTFKTYAITSVVFESRSRKKRETKTKIDIYAREREISIKTENLIRPKLLASLQKKF